MTRITRKLLTWGLILTGAIAIGMLPGVALGLATSVAVCVVR